MKRNKSGQDYFGNWSRPHPGRWRVAANAPGRAGANKTDPRDFLKVPLACRPPTTSTAPQTALNCKAPCHGAANI